MSGSETHRGILVGVDRSASSMAAVDWAARDAAMRNVPLTLMHVVAPVVPAVAPWPEIPIPQDYFERQDDKARRILEDARRAVADSTADHGPPFVHSVVLHGPTVSTLVNQSKIADMMVVGCRGEGAFSRVPFGSVSTGLVNYAHCPVAVVHDEAPPLAQAPVLVESTVRPHRNWRRRSPLTRPSAGVWTWWHCMRGRMSACRKCQVWISRRWKCRHKRRWPSGSPDGRSATPMSRCNVWWCAISRLVNLSSTRSPHNSSSSAVTVAADSPACCWVR